MSDRIAAGSYSRVLSRSEFEKYGRSIDLTRASRAVVLACDEAYAMPLSTALRSIVEASQRSWPLVFHVLSERFSERARRKVFESLPIGSASIHWIPIDLELFRDFSTLAYISRMTYARLLIPRIFPDAVSRVLYLDADLLVLDDLAPLWETDLQGAVIGAVRDGLDSHIKADTAGFEGLPRVREYFNAGVLLLDLDRWRKERISERSLEYLARHPSSPYSDQDALNVVCDGRWKALDSRWNFQAHCDQNFAAMAKDRLPGIVHFVTDSKPWKPSSLSLNASFYDAFRRRTCYARDPVKSLWDMLQGMWYRLKHSLKRYRLVRIVWRRMLRAKPGGVV